MSKSITELDKILDRITEPSELHYIIKESRNNTTECDKNNTAIHTHCIVGVTCQKGNIDLENHTNNGTQGENKNLNDYLPKAQCQDALIYILIKLISLKPKLFDDEAKNLLVKYFKSNNIEARGIVSLENLSRLYSTNESQLITWIKYESLLIHLIKEQVYLPKTMANEVLAIVKNDLHPNIATKFSSVISSCVKYCREQSNKSGNIDEEEKEKWCEIIDWMSWFIGGGQDNDL